METIVTDLPTSGNHTTKSVVVLGGDIIVSVGSATNSCQEQDRKARSPGLSPCVETDTRAGLWRFSASRPNQKQADGVRYASGIRNAVGLSVQPGTNQVFATQHGRDQLAQNWGFTNEKSAENPAEELMAANAGDDFGWPYCYYDVDEKSLVLAPEYGGDGKTVGRCAMAKEPVAAFPGHWAPNAVTFAKPGALGAAFGAGAFVAFHGSWNRAPLPQAGYRVVFQPLNGTKPAGTYTTVAVSASGETDLRPAGLAVAPDGALFIAADKNNRIWRVVKGS
jgi:glucose/arabinose dehydrogenase